MINVMQKLFFLFLCVLASFIVIEAKPWCGLNGCDSGEQNEEGGSRPSNEDVSSESNENELGQSSYVTGDQGNYDKVGHGQDINGASDYIPGGHGQGINGPGGYLPYVPSQYFPSGYAPGGYIPSRYVPNLYYVPGGYVPVYIPGGHSPGGYFPGGHGQGGHVPSGFAPGGFFQGGRGPGSLSIDIYLRNFNNGHGFRGVTGNEIGGHVSGGPCGIGGNPPCDGRQPYYPYINDNGFNDVSEPKDCPNCNIISFGDGENNVNTFNLPKKAYD